MRNEELGMRNGELGMRSGAGVRDLEFFYRVIFPIPKGKLSFALLSCGKIFGGVRGLTKGGNGTT